MTSHSRRITRLLVANRGEIAVRVMVTAKARGIECVAVYSEPDSHAAHVEAADLAVALGGTTSAQSYLDVDKVLAAARTARADAIHPGYGFLSENATFAQAVIDAGLIWVGPPPAAIAAMAEKVPAKRLVADAGVPLVPGAELADDLADTALVAIAAQVGYPLMVKASAGGGGKGMRVVQSEAELVEAVAGARREAASAFGDATVFLERFLPTARHIEVQVFADDHGNVAHLFERECSIQRRHQKVIEEAPAAFLSDATRAGLHAAAVDAAAAIEYRGAGTVEFLVAGEEYFFLEMNTRLQVEHPVTEMVTGLDLVGLQLDVAQGLALPELPQSPSGHAIEARLYAEDPARDDLPSVGTLYEFDLSDPRVRVDSGFRAGDVVSPYYDPMLAKVIAHADTREQAAAVLAAALNAATIHGVVTNRELLVAVLRHDDFQTVASSTAFLTEHAHLRQRTHDPVTLVHHSVAAAAGWWFGIGADVPDVAAQLAPSGWRNVPRPGGLSVTFTGSDAEQLHDGAITVHRRATRSGTAQWGWAPGGEAPGVHSDEVQWLDLSVAVTSDGVAGAQVHVRAGDGLTSRCRVQWHEDEAGTSVWVDDALGHTTWQVPSLFGRGGAAGAAGGPSTPVPGTVAAVLVSAGEAVTAGQTLVVVEAMKMEHRISADGDATVSDVLVNVGDSVEAHQVLVVLQEEDSS